MRRTLSLGKRVSEAESEVEGEEENDKNSDRLLFQSLYRCVDQLPFLPLLNMLIPLSPILSLVYFELDLIEKKS